MKTINNKLIKLTELLNDNQYHDGMEIGNQLAITRAGVWKIIKKLQQYGVDIKTSKGKGYCLRAPLVLLNSHKIKSLVNDKSISLNILEKIDSTNDYLKTILTDNKNIQVCIAEMQTQGRGRLNRHWHSPFGENIYLSILYPINKDISELSGLSLVVGLAIAKAIEETTLLEKLIQVKWPNDIVIEDQKVAGTLIEIQAESNGFCRLIIGIGMNVNMQKAKRNEINQKWTSLYNLSKQYQDRNLLSAKIINLLVDYLNQFSQFGLQKFIDEWNAKDYLSGRNVNVISGKEKHRGLGVGINEQGHLLLKLKDTRIKAFSSGDTSILK